jgi:hypothetical protein
MSLAPVHLSLKVNPTIKELLTFHSSPKADVAPQSGSATRQPLNYLIRSFGKEVPDEFALLNSRCLKSVG